MNSITHSGHRKGHHNVHYPLYLLSVLLIFYFLGECQGDISARLIDPPPRGSLWRYGYQTSINHNDGHVNCGGQKRHWRQNNGRCGVCGDATDGPQDHDNGGKYDAGFIVRSFPSGSIINITYLTPPGVQGSVRVEICPLHTSRDFLTERCFLSNSLSSADVISEETTTDRNLITLPRTSSFHLIPGITCAHCVIRWIFVRDDPNCPDCKEKETFINCADISITKQSLDSPTTVTKKTQLLRRMKRQLNFFSPNPFMGQNIQSFDASQTIETRLPFGQVDSQVTFHNQQQPQVAPSSLDRDSPPFGIGNHDPNNPLQDPGHSRSSANQQDFLVQENQQNVQFGHVNGNNPSSVDSFSSWRNQNNAADRNRQIFGINIGSDIPNVLGQTNLNQNRMFESGVQSMQNQDTTIHLNANPWERGSVQRSNEIPNSNIARQQERFHRDFRSLIPSPDLREGNMNMGDGMTSSTPLPTPPLLPPQFTGFQETSVSGDTNFHRSFNNVDSSGFPNIPVNDNNEKHSQRNQPERMGKSDQNQNPNDEIWNWNSPFLSTNNNSSQFTWGNAESNTDSDKALGEVSKSRTSQNSTIARNATRSGNETRNGDILFPINQHMEIGVQPFPIPMQPHLQHNPRLHPFQVHGPLTHGSQNQFPIRGNIPQGPILPSLSNAGLVDSMRPTPNVHITQENTAIHNSPTSHNTLEQEQIPVVIQEFRQLLPANSRSSIEIFPNPDAHLIEGHSNMRNSPQLSTNLGQSLTSVVQEGLPPLPNAEHAENLNPNIHMTERHIMQDRSNQLPNNLGQEMTVVQQEGSQQNADIPSIQQPNAQNLLLPLLVPPQPPADLLSELANPAVIAVNERKIVNRKNPVHHGVLQEVGKENTNIRKNTPLEAHAHLGGGLLFQNFHQTSFSHATIHTPDGIQHKSNTQSFSNSIRPDLTMNKQSQNDKLLTIGRNVMNSQNENQKRSPDIHFTETHRIMGNLPQHIQGAGQSLPQVTQRGNQPPLPNVGHSQIVHIPSQHANGDFRTRMNDVNIFPSAANAPHINQVTGIVGTNTGTGHTDFREGFPSNSVFEQNQNHYENQNNPMVEVGIKGFERRQQMNTGANFPQELVPQQETAKNTVGHSLTVDIIPEVNDIYHQGSHGSTLDTMIDGKSNNNHPPVSSRDINTINIDLPSMPTGSEVHIISRNGRMNENMNDVVWRSSNIEQVNDHTRRMETTEITKPFFPRTNNEMFDHRIDKVKNSNSKDTTTNIRSMQHGGIQPIDKSRNEVQSSSDPTSRKHHDLRLANSQNHIAVTSDFADHSSAADTRPSSLKDIFMNSAQDGVSRNERPLNDQTQNMNNDVHTDIFPTKGNLNSEFSTTVANSDGIHGPFQEMNGYTTTISNKNRKVMDILSSETSIQPIENNGFIMSSNVPNLRQTISDQHIALNDQFIPRTISQLSPLSEGIRKEKLPQIPELHRKLTKVTHPLASTVEGNAQNIRGSEPWRHKQIHELSGDSLNDPGHQHRPKEVRSQAFVRFQRTKPRDNTFSKTVQMNDPKVDSQVIVEIQNGNIESLDTNRQRDLKINNNNPKLGLVSVLNSAHKHFGNDILDKPSTTTHIPRLQEPKKESNIKTMARTGGLEGYLEETTSLSHHELIPKSVKSSTPFPLEQNHNLIRESVEGINNTQRDASGSSREFSSRNHMSLGSIDNGAFHNSFHKSINQPRKGQNEHELKTPSSGMGNNPQGADKNAGHNDSTGFLGKMKFQGSDNALGIMSLSSDLHEHFHSAELSTNQLDFNNLATSTTYPKWEMPAQRQTNVIDRQLLTSSALHITPTKSTIAIKPTAPVNTIKNALSDKSPKGSNTASVDNNHHEDLIIGTDKRKTGLPSVINFAHQKPGDVITDMPRPTSYIPHSQELMKDSNNVATDHTGELTVFPRETSPSPRRKILLETAGSSTPSPVEQKNHSKDIFVEEHRNVQRNATVGSGERRRFVAGNHVTLNSFDTGGFHNSFHKPIDQLQRSQNEHELKTLSTDIQGMPKLPARQNDSHTLVEKVKVPEGTSTKSIMSLSSKPREHSPTEVVFNTLATSTAYPNSVIPSHELTNVNERLSVLSKAFRSTSTNLTISTIPTTSENLIQETVSDRFSLESKKSQEYQPTNFDKFILLKQHQERIAALNTGGATNKERDINGVDSRSTPLLSTPSTTTQSSGGSGSMNIAKTFEGTQHDAHNSSKSISTAKIGNTVEKERALLHHQERIVAFNTGMLTGNENFVKAAPHPNTQAPFVNNSSVYRTTTTSENPNFSESLKHTGSTTTNLENAKTIHNNTLVDKQTLLTLHQERIAAFNNGRLTNNAQPKISNKTSPPTMKLPITTTTNEFLLKQSELSSTTHSVGNSVLMGVQNNYPKVNNSQLLNDSKLWKNNSTPWPRNEVDTAISTTTVNQKLMNTSTSLAMGISEQPIFSSLEVSSSPSVFGVQISSLHEQIIAFEKSKSNQSKHIENKGKIIDSHSLPNGNAENTTATNIKTNNLSSSNKTKRSNNTVDVNVQTESSKVNSNMLAEVEDKPSSSSDPFLDMLLAFDNSNGSTTSSSINTNSNSTHGDILMGDESPKKLETNEKQFAHSENTESGLIHLNVGSQNEDKSRKSMTSFKPVEQKSSLNEKIIAFNMLGARPNLNEVIDGDTKKVQVSSKINSVQNNSFTSTGNNKMFPDIPINRRHKRSIFGRGLRLSVATEKPEPQQKIFNNGILQQTQTHFTRNPSEVNKEISVIPLMKVTVLPYSRSSLSLSTNVGRSSEPFRKVETTHPYTSFRTTKTPSVTNLHHNSPYAVDPLLMQRLQSQHYIVFNGLGSIYDSIYAPQQKRQDISTAAPTTLSPPQGMARFNKVRTAFLSTNGAPKRQTNMFINSGLATTQTPVQMTSSSPTAAQSSSTNIQIFQPQTESLTSTPKPDIRFRSTSYNITLSENTTTDAALEASKAETKLTTQVSEEVVTTRRTPLTSSASLTIDLSNKKESPTTEAQAPTVTNSNTELTTLSSAVSTKSSVSTAAKMWALSNLGMSNIQDFNSVKGQYFVISNLDEVIARKPTTEASVQMPSPVDSSVINKKKATNEKETSVLDIDRDQIPKFDFVDMAAGLSSLMGNGALLSYLKSIRNKTTLPERSSDLSTLPVKERQERKDVRPKVTEIKLTPETLGLSNANLTVSTVQTVTSISDKFKQVTEKHAESQKYLEKTSTFGDVTELSAVVTLLPKFSASSIETSTEGPENRTYDQESFAITTTSHFTRANATTPMTQTTDAGPTGISVKFNKTTDKVISVNETDMNSTGAENSSTEGFISSTSENGKMEMWRNATTTSNNGIVHVTSTESMTSISQQSMAPPSETVTPQMTTTDLQQEPTSTVSHLITSTIDAPGNAGEISRMDSSAGEKLQSNFTNVPKLTQQDTRAFRQQTRVLQVTSMSDNNNKMKENENSTMLTEVHETESENYTTKSIPVTSTATTKVTLSTHISTTTPMPTSTFRRAEDTSTPEAGISMNGSVVTEVKEQIIETKYLIAKKERKISENHYLDSLNTLTDTNSPSQNVTKTYANMGTPNTKISTSKTNDTLTYISNVLAPTKQVDKSKYTVVSEHKPEEYGSSNFSTVTPKSRIAEKMFGIEETRGHKFDYVASLSGLSNINMASAHLQMVVPKRTLGKKDRMIIWSSESEGNSLPVQEPVINLEKVARQRKPSQKEGVNITNKTNHSSSGIFENAKEQHLGLPIAIDGSDGFQINITDSKTSKKYNDSKAEYMNISPSLPKENVRKMILFDNINATERSYLIEAGQELEQINNTTKSSVKTTPISTVASESKNNDFISHMGQKDVYTISHETEMTTQKETAGVMISFDFFQTTETNPSIDNNGVDGKASKFHFTTTDTDTLFKNRKFEETTTTSKAGTGKLEKLSSAGSSELTTTTSKPTQKIEVNFFPNATLPEWIVKNLMATVVMTEPNVSSSAARFGVSTNPTTGGTQEPVSRMASLGSLESVTAASIALNESNISPPTNVQNNAMFLEAGTLKTPSIDQSKMSTTHKYERTTPLFIGTTDKSSAINPSSYHHTEQDKSDRTTTGLISRNKQKRLPASYPTSTVLNMLSLDSIVPLEGATDGTIPPTVTVTQTNPTSIHQSMRKMATKDTKKPISETTDIYNAKFDMMTTKMDTSDTVFPTSTKSTFPSITENRIPSRTKTTFPTNTDAASPSSTEATLPTSTETTSAKPHPTSTEATLPTSTETTSAKPHPTSTEVTLYASTEATSTKPHPTSTEATLPTSTQATSIKSHPTSTEATLPISTEATRLKSHRRSNEATSPASTETTSIKSHPTNTEATFPTSTEATLPTSTEATLPTSTEATSFINSHPTSTQAKFPKSTETTLPTSTEATSNTKSHTTSTEDRLSTSTDATLLTNTEIRTVSSNMDFPTNITYTSKSGGRIIYLEDFLTHPSIEQTNVPPTISPSNLPRSFKYQGSSSSITTVIPSKQTTSPFVDRRDSAMKTPVINILHLEQNGRTPSVAYITATQNVSGTQGVDMETRSGKASTRSKESTKFSRSTPVASFDIFGSVLDEAHRTFLGTTHPTNLILEASLKSDAFSQKTRESKFSSDSLLTNSLGKQESEIGNETNLPSKSVSEVFNESNSTSDQFPQNHFGEIRNTKEKEDVDVNGTTISEIYFQEQSTEVATTNSETDSTLGQSTQEQSTFMATSRSPEQSSNEPKSIEDQSSSALLTKLLTTSSTILEEGESTTLQTSTSSVNQLDHTLSITNVTLLHSTTAQTTFPNTQEPTTVSSIDSSTQRTTTALVSNNGRKNTRHSGPLSSPLRTMWPSTPSSFSISSLQRNDTTVNVQTINRDNTNLGAVTSKNTTNKIVIQRTTKLVKPTTMPRRRATGLPLFTSNIITQIPFFYKPAIRKKIGGGRTLSINLRLVKKELYENITFDNYTDVNDSFIEKTHIFKTIDVYNITNNETVLSNETEVNAFNLEISNDTYSDGRNQSSSNDLSNVTFPEDPTTPTNLPPLSEYEHKQISIRKIRSTRKPVPTPSSIVTISAQRNSNSGQDIRIDPILVTIDLEGNHSSVKLSARDKIIPGSERKSSPRLKENVLFTQTASGNTKSSNRQSIPTDFEKRTFLMTQPYAYNTKPSTEAPLPVKIYSTRADASLYTAIYTKHTTNSDVNETGERFSPPLFKDHESEMLHNSGSRNNKIADRRPGFLFGENKRNISVDTNHIRSSLIGGLSIKAHPENNSAISLPVPNAERANLVSKPTDKHFEYGGDVVSYGHQIGQLSSTESRNDKNKNSFSLARNSLSAAHAPLQINGGSSLSARRIQHTQPSSQQDFNLGDNQDRTVGRRQFSTNKDNIASRSSFQPGVSESSLRREHVKSAWEGGVYVGVEDTSFSDANVASLSSNSAFQNTLGRASMSELSTVGNVAFWSKGIFIPAELISGDQSRQQSPNKVSSVSRFASLQREQQKGPEASTRSDFYYPVVRMDTAPSNTRQNSLLSGIPISMDSGGSSLGISFSDNVGGSISGNSGGLSQLSSGTSWGGTPVRSLANSGSFSDGQYIPPRSSLTLQNSLSQGRRFGRSTSTNVRLSTMENSTEKSRSATTENLALNKLVVDAQELCTSGEIFACFGKNSHARIPGIKWWCVQNCRHGNCPLSKCRCGCQKNGSNNIRDIQFPLVQSQIQRNLQVPQTTTVSAWESTTRRTVWNCRPTKAYAPVSGLGEWCNRMCSLKACPRHMCKC